MKTRKMAAGAVLPLGVIALVGPLSTSPAVQAPCCAGGTSDQQAVTALTSERKSPLFARGFLSL